MHETAVLISQSSQNSKGSQALVLFPGCSRMQMCTRRESGNWQPTMQLTIGVYDIRPTSSPPPLFGFGVWEPGNEASLAWYCIAGNFWRRKLSQISRLCGYSRKLSPQNFGVWCSLARKKLAISDGFLRNNWIFHLIMKVFSLESFLLYVLIKTRPAPRVTLHNVGLPFFKEMWYIDCSSTV